MPAQAVNRCGMMPSDESNPGHQINPQLRAFSAEATDITRQKKKKKIHLCALLYFLIHGIHEYIKRLFTLYY